MSSEANKFFHEISNLSTEQRNLASMEIDAKSTRDILTIINNEDQKIAKVVESEILQIEKAVDLIVHALKNGGRLLYFGAGTSGRLGVVDASECPPTFGVNHEMVQGFIAGGKEAMFRSQEGAEDYEENGEKDVVNVAVNKNDVVCGIAASKRTPYVVGAVKKAKQIGATTIFVTCNPRSTFNMEEVDVSICLDVGPEVIMGSTRMKSGTATKLVLNMMTTASMIRLGKVYENMMIDLQQTNKKLMERSKKIIMTITGVTYEEAGRFLLESGGHVKTSLVMILAGVNKDEAKKRLDNSDGFVREALKQP
ncbi:MAG: N-acetylmuramic acid 6-phosphate etherase [Melioribacteraceae bacterium]|nr:N-acetylmuramic acid 6-phosphate etherase [Melioribacteraceae bacterium]